jgi:hypothetical protein
MTFTVKVSSYNLQSLMRYIGYKPIGTSPEGQLSCVRQFGGDYPRFHAYVKQGPDGFRFDLHLDQKKASYEGSRMHNGEYDGETVEREHRRIMSLVSDLDENNT